VKKIVAIVLLASFVPAQLVAWGPKGHQIVGDIARSRLTPTTQKNLELLLGSTDLASIANWADEVRPQRPEAYGWHFVDIPKDAAGYSAERDCFRPDPKHENTLTDHHNCVVDRIEMFSQVLGDPRASREQRLEALKWVVHFIGDLHQPLHAIDEARGGNDLKIVEFGSTQCGKYECNLHWAWDSDILEHTGYSEAEYVGRLNKLIERQHLEAQAGGTVTDWANESHNEARAIVNQKPAVVDDAYYRANIDLINRRLALAGLRLAAVLNKTLGNIPTATLKQDLEMRSHAM